MTLTQEQLNQATVLIEEHLNDIGIKNQFTFLGVSEKENEENVRVFSYEIANPSFKTMIQIEFDFLKNQQQINSSSSFSWMDYKKITE